MRLLLWLVGSSLVLLTGCTNAGPNPFLFEETVPKKDFDELEARVKKLEKNPAASTNLDVRLTGIEMRMQELSKMYQRTPPVLETVAVTPTTPIVQQMDPMAFSQQYQRDMLKLVAYWLGSNPTPPPLPWEQYAQWQRDLEGWAAYYGVLVLKIERPCRGSPQCPEWTHYVYPDARRMRQYPMIHWHLHYYETSNQPVLYIWH